MGDHQKGAHQWIIEFEKAPLDLEFFTTALDNSLKTINSDYEAKRHKNLALEKPHIIGVPQGTFYNWMKNRQKVGGQNKIPRLSNDRKYLDELLKMIQD